MIKKLSAISLLAAALVFAFACRQADAPIEYVKYENDASVPRITAEEAKKGFDAGRVIFVDSRGDAAFNEEHLPGSISIPFGSTEDKYSQLPKGKKIITYCS